MRYDLNNPIQYLEATKRLQEFASKGKIVELHAWRKSKTEKQNNYLHFLCRYFATQYGCTTAEAKEVYLKRNAAPNIFARTKINKLGQAIVTYRSVSDLDTGECMSAIRNFIEWAAIGGIELPLPEDEPFKRYAEKEVEDLSHLI